MTITEEIPYIKIVAITFNILNNKRLQCWDAHYNVCRLLWHANESPQIKADPSPSCPSKLRRSNVHQNSRHSRFWCSKAHIAFCFAVNVGPITEALPRSTVSLNYKLCILSALLKGRSCQIYGIWQQSGVLFWQPTCKTISQVWSKTCITSTV